MTLIDAMQALRTQSEATALVTAKLEKARLEHEKPTHWKPITPPSGDKP